MRKFLGFRCAGAAAAVVGLAVAGCSPAEDDLAEPTFVEQTSEDYAEDDEPVAPGTMCGAASGDTLVEVREGSVSCLEAQEIIDEYEDRRESEGGGNTLAMTVGDWDCSSPTAGRSAELEAGGICYGPDDGVIATPLPTR
ncbi:MAG: hypothetical protein ACTIL2_08090 [Corynebacterium sp.]|uniref:hypothetical protein n=1 Tax=Corynebacterium sp. TaxID=1720 RepID=UPI003F99AE34